LFIQTEDTPNPATLKFIPGRPVLFQGTAQFVEGDDTSACFLADQLFKISGVQGVFFGKDFLTITKAHNTDWALIKPSLLGAIMDYFTQNEHVHMGAPLEKKIPQEEDDISREIRELIDTRIRPAVAQDGGDIEFEYFENGVVYVRLHGSCSGCPSSQETLKLGIENMLKHYVPEVTDVRPL
jgi:Fe-S cluster biogenesis protein NfuA